MLVFINKFVLYLLSVKNYLNRSFDTINRALLVTHQTDLLSSGLVISSYYKFM